MSLERNKPVKPVSLKSQCNRSSDRSFLPLCDTHQSEMDYQKEKKASLHPSFFLSVDD